MKVFATVRAYDQPTERVINLGWDPFTDIEGVAGFQVTATCTDVVGYFRALSEEQCARDVHALWGRWDTYVLLP